MRKVIGIVICLMLMAGVAHADDLYLGDTLKSMPGIKTGIVYSLQEKELGYAATVDVLEFNGFTLGAGVASHDNRVEDFKEINKLIATVSYKVGKLADYGINVPLLDLVDLSVGAYAGYSRIDIKENSSEGNNESDFGLYASLVSVKF